MAQDEGTLPICRAGGKGGMVFPLGLEAEFSWPDGLRGALYAIAMVYWFCGVAIVADLFMASIETVTGRRRKTIGENGKPKTVKVWNETVATLTLMALGSSAPEIFLSVIDIVKKEFHFGALGPSTIVGSAAFNLLVIIAVCIVVIPAGEDRVIKSLPAFYITAAFSMVAYIWMALILSVFSPDIVELWEAVVTFLLLPVLVYISYKTDRGDADGLMTKMRLIAPPEEGTEANSAGFVSFSSEHMQVHGSESETTLEVVVMRRKVSCAPGPVSCNYRTEPATAVPGFDYEGAEGSIEFAEGETEKSISFTILGKSCRIVDLEFLVVLQELEGGPSFDPDMDGGDDEAILTITIQKHGPEAGAMHRALHAVCSADSLKLALSEWKEQVVSTLFVNGSLEEQREASPTDWCLHLLALPWKLTFGLLPPTCLMGGWALFYTSLLGIAILTTCVSDLAELFGCVLGIPDIVTAVTFVALGTSMPDLFASLSAAKEDPTADASIVNVTGSNSVNVFLGLGVPWTVAAVYWQITGRTAVWESTYPTIAASMTGSAFVVESSDLGFSVGMFCYVCVLALLLLYARRRWVKCELGGPVLAKWLSGGTLLLLWFAWVGVVSWRVLRPNVDGGETAGIFGAIFFLTVGGTAASVIMIRKSAVLVEEDEEGQKVADGVPAKTVDEPDVRFAADTGGTGGTASPRTAEHAEVSKPGAMGTIPKDQDAPLAPSKELEQAMWDDSFFADDLGEEKFREPMAQGANGRRASSGAVR